MKTDKVISDLVGRAMRSRIIGKTVADRVTLIAKEQRNAVRLILLRSIRKGEAADVIVDRVKKFYAGAKGNGGPAYMARRLVQSETTRFNGRVAIRMGALIREDTGRIPIFTYHTQGDDKVRDSHAALDGVEFAPDDVAESLGMRPVSEAEAALDDPNCRCWLDVSYEGAPDRKVTDSSKSSAAPKASTADRKQRLIDAIQRGDKASVLSSVNEYLKQG